MSQPQQNSTHQIDFDVDCSIVERVIRSRRTFKVLRSLDAPVDFAANVLAKRRSQVQHAIASAGWAPFHYDRGVDGIAEPWRVDVMWHGVCQRVADSFYHWFDDVKPSNKLPAMLNACGACVLVSWLPQFSPATSNLTGAEGVGKTGSSAIPTAKQVQIDQEHLAASSAFVQNLLLLLTAQNMGTYWSSGGQLGSPTAMAKLSLPQESKLLAAVFVEFPETRGDASIERLPGKLASKRSPAEQWCREVQLAQEQPQ